MSTLKKLGFENVYNLAGGFAGWQQAGLPVEK
jgi:rhodanese-related sulfurtransferase